MQLDKTEIAIRERSMLELMDLAVHLCRIYLPWLAATAAIGIAPFFIWNRILLGWIVQVDPSDYSSLQYSGFVMRYTASMAMLVFLQSPLATALMVSWLGRSVFSQQPPLREVLLDAARSWWRLALCQGILRGSLLATVIVTLLVDQDYDRKSELAVLILATFAFMLVRGFRPFLLEIILLERNPLRQNKQRNVITIAKRNSNLHGAGAGQLFAVLMGSGVFINYLCCAVFGTFLFVQGVMLNRWTLNSTLLLYVLPASMWLCASLMTVFRFLTYLDLRIRQEGWAVELRMRAEAARLQNDLMLTP